jgi:hypothetical protein
MRASPFVLIQQEMSYVSEVCDHGILELRDGLFDRQDEIKTISVHQESAAAIARMGSA